MAILAITKSRPTFSISNVELHYTFSISNVELHYIRAYSTHGRCLMGSQWIGFFFWGLNGLNSWISVGFSINCIDTCVYWFGMSLVGMQAGLSGNS